MAIKICVPRSWKRRVKSSMLHAISLARYCMASIQGKAATDRSPRVCLQARIDQFEHDNSLLQDRSKTPGTTVIVLNNALNYPIPASKTPWTSTPSSHQTRRTPGDRLEGLIRSPERGAVGRDRLQTEIG